MQSLIQFTGTQRKTLLVVKTHLDSISGFFSNAHVLDNMLQILNFFWVLVLCCSGYVFGLILRVILRDREPTIVADNKSESSFDRGGNNQETNKGNQESDDSFALGSALATSTSRCQFISGKDVIKFVKEPPNVCFSVQEFYVGSHDYGSCNSQCLDKEVPADNNSLECLGGDESACICSTEKVLGKEEIIVTEDEIFDRGDAIDFEDSISADSECSYHSDSGRNGSGPEISRTDHGVDLVTSESLLDKNVGEGLRPEIENTMVIDGEEEAETEAVSPLETFRMHAGAGLDSNSNEVFVSDQFENFDEELLILDSRTQHSSERDAVKSSVDSICGVDLVSEQTEDVDAMNRTRLGLRGDESNDSDEECEKLQSNSQNPGESNAEKLSGDGICLPAVFCQAYEDTDTLERNGELSFQDKSPTSDDEDLDDMDTENDDLLKQFKSEMRRMRTGGLPTILEESESPKMEEDYLTPLKIEQKFDYKYQMDEIQKVYKSYAERMRKLDILNYQNLNAIGLQQKKDPKFLVSSKKFSVLSVKSIIPSNMWPYKARRIAADPTVKYVEELHKGLEMVYIGQVCLSWEILRWQYLKAQELQGHDTQGFRQFNQAAGEFQLFQVLVQRFLEDEPFQGPRVQNYVKNRCHLRSLLQVPAIKDDYSKDKRYGKGGDPRDAISCKRLTEIIEESMRVFWEFVRADKDEASLISKGLELQDPADLELLIDIRSDLQKKEKKLRDILRSSNCIVKMFQKRRGHRLPYTLLFAQVDLKVVSRVTNMSKLTTDQLQWCREKLDRIEFSSRKIHLEPSFLLFPC